MTARTLTAPTLTTPESTRWRYAAKRAEKASLAAEHLAGQMWRVASASTPGMWHTVTLTRDERGFVAAVRCDCLGGSKTGNVCQHAAAVALVAPALEVGE